MNAHLIQPVLKLMAETSSSAGSESPYHLINGLKVPKFVAQEEYDKLKTLKLYSDDVWIVTYPKCGTTWTQQIVKLIRNNGEHDGMKITSSVPWLEAITIYPEVKIEELTRPRAFKSHFPYSLMPCGPPHTTPCKYIFVVRNPKDVAVSLYFHIQKFCPCSWDSFWNKYVSGDLPFGNYFDHLLEWWPRRNDKNVLFMKFEDMKKDLKRCVSEIASFMGVSVTSDVIDKIADMTSFEKMKEDNTTNYSWEKWAQKPDIASFMRKGIVGDWKNFLSLEQSAEMDVICATRLKDTDLEFTYE